MFAPVEQPSPTPSASLAEDFIDIWFTPSAVFARRAGRSAWGPFLVTSLLLIVLFAAAMGPMQGFLDAELAKAVAQAREANPAMTDAQLERVQRGIEMSIRYGGLVAMPFVLLVGGVLTWLASKLLGGTLSVGGGIMVASFAQLPKALDFVSIMIQSFVLEAPSRPGQFQYSIGVGRVLDPAMSPGLYQLLGRIEVFSLWTVVLVVLGLIHAGKVERGKAIAGAVGLWVLGAAPALLQLLRG